jgi:hypothetical protein
MLALPDLGERKQTVGLDVPRSHSLGQPDPSVDRVARVPQLAAPSLNPAVDDVHDRRKRVLIELRSSHQLDCLGRERLGLHDVLLVELNRSAAAERESLHGRKLSPPRRAGHLFEDRLGLRRLPRPPQRGPQQDLRCERPAGLGRGRGRKGAAGGCNRPADVASEQSQPRSQRGHGTGRLLTIADDGRRALGQRKPALCLVEPARVRRHHRCCETQQPVLGDDAIGQRVQPARHGCELSVAQEEGVVAPHQLHCRINVAGGGGVICCLDDQAGLVVPAARAAVEKWNDVGFRPRQLVLEELREEWVVAVPLALRVERNQEQVRALEPLEDFCRIVAICDCVA